MRCWAASPWSNEDERNLNGARAGPDGKVATLAAAGASDEYSPAGVAELRRVGSEGVWRAWLLAPVMPLAVLAAQLREEAMGTRADTVSRWVAGAKLPARERACLYVALVVIDCFAA